MGRIQHALAAAVTATALLAGYVAPAQATVSMCVYTGPAVGCTAAGGLIIADGSGSDLNPLVGAISFFSLGFGGYDFVQAGGAGYPSTTLNTSAPAMNLDLTANVFSGGKPDLVVELTDNAWGPTLGTTGLESWISSADGQASLKSLSTYWDPAGSLFARTNALSAIGPITGAPDIDTVLTTLGAPATDYSITMVAVLSGARVGQNALVSSLQTAVPGPSLLLLLGAGGLGLFGIRAARDRNRTAV